MEDLPQLCSTFLVRIGPHGIYAHHTNTVHLLQIQIPILTEGLLTMLRLVVDTIDLDVDQLQQSPWLIDVFHSINTTRIAFLVSPL